MLVSWARTFFLCDIFRVRTSDEPCNSSLYSFTYNKTQELPQRVREHNGNDLRKDFREKEGQSVQNSWRCYPYSCNRDVKDSLSLEEKLNKRVERFSLDALSPLTSYIRLSHSLHLLGEVSICCNWWAYIGPLLSLRISSLH